MWANFCSLHGSKILELPFRSVCNFNVQYSRSLLHVFWEVMHVEFLKYLLAPLDKHFYIQLFLPKFESIWAKVFAQKGKISQNKFARLWFFPLFLEPCLIICPKNPQCLSCISLVDLKLKPRIVFFQIIDQNIGFYIKGGGGGGGGFVKTPPPKKGGGGGGREGG